MNTTRPVLTEAQAQCLTALVGLLHALLSGMCDASAMPPALRRTIESCFATLSAQLAANPPSIGSEPPTPNPNPSDHPAVSNDGIASKNLRFRHNQVIADPWHGKPTLMQNPHLARARSPPAFIDRRGRNTRAVPIGSTPNANPIAIPNCEHQSQRIRAPSFQTSINRAAPGHPGRRAFP